MGVPQPGQGEGTSRGQSRAWLHPIGGRRSPSRERGRVLFLGGEGWGLGRGSASARCWRTLARCAVIPCQSLFDGRQLLRLSDHVTSLLEHCVQTMNQSRDLHGRRLARHALFEDRLTDSLGGRRDVSRCSHLEPHLAASLCRQWSKLARTCASQVRSLLPIGNKSPATLAATISRCPWVLVNLHRC